MGQITLIGGSSSVGKTVVARALSQRLGMTCLHLDHYLRTVADPSVAFRDGRDGFWKQSGQELCDQLVQAAERAVSHIRALVEAWLAQERSGIIEGERIHPRLVVELVRTSDSVKGVFIVEGDEELLYRTLLQRSESFGDLPEPQRWRVVEMNRLYGAWLRSEARQRQLACVESQPRKTLADRVSAAVG